MRIQGLITTVSAHAQVRRGVSLKRWVNQCNHGPQNDTGKTAAAALKELGMRFAPAAQGKGLKCGCKGTFTVRQLANRPDVVEIRYYNV